MNHSELVIARNVVKREINRLQLYITDNKISAAYSWKLAQPVTSQGRFHFRKLNSLRTLLRKEKRELAALEKLSATLRTMMRMECQFQTITELPPVELDADGFDADGYDEEGFDRDGYNRDGWHREDGWPRV